MAEIAGNVTRDPTAGLLLPPIAGECGLCDEIHLMVLNMALTPEGKCSLVRFATEEFGTAPAKTKAVLSWLCAVRILARPDIAIGLPRVLRTAEPVIWQVAKEYATAARDGAMWPGLSVRHVAHQLRMTEHGVRWLITEGRLTARQVPSTGRWLILAASVEVYAWYRKFHRGNIMVTSGNTSLQVRGLSVSGNGQTGLRSAHTCRHDSVDLAAGRCA